MGCIKLDILENRYKTPELKIVYAKKELTSKKSSSEGRNYYHARYYDPRTSVFLGVDRFAEKYASLTPYHYAANNPIMFIDINGDSLDVANNQQSRDDISGMVKNKNQQYISYSGDNLSLNFGNLSQKETDKILKKDKGLALLNDLSTAKENYSYAATHQHGEGLEYSANANGPYQAVSKAELKSLNTTSLVGQTIGAGPKQFAWFTNTSKTPRGDEATLGVPYIRPSAASGYDAIVTISPGTVYDGNGSAAKRSNYVRHELREAYLRTTSGMTYQQAHQKSGAPFSFSKFLYKK